MKTTEPTLAEKLVQQKRDLETSIHVIDSWLAKMRIGARLEVDPPKVSRWQRIADGLSGTLVIRDSKREIRVPAEIQDRFYAYLQRERDTQRKVLQSVDTQLQSLITGHVGSD